MNTSNAKHCVACDECGASLGELYPNDHNNISVQLSDMGKHHAGDSETAYHNPEKSLSSKKTFHFCDESCMASNLNKRAKAKAKMSKMSKANVVDYQGNIEVDMTDYLKKKEFELSEAAYISTHERSKLGEEHFLDKKRRSFPIRPGHECTDLNAALHRIGTYKGELSHEELHSKILSRMKSHGCPLPKSDK